MLHYHRKLIQQLPESKYTASVIFLRYEFKIFSMNKPYQKNLKFFTSVEKCLIRSDLLGRHAFRNGLLKEKYPKIVNIHGRNTNVKVKMVQLGWLLKDFKLYGIMYTER